AVSILGTEVALTAEQNAALAGTEEKDIIVGLRPVHVKVGSEGIAAKVDVSELMGSELHLHLTTAEGDMVAVVPTADINTDDYTRGSSVNFSFDPKLLHLFDKETEKNLI
ncbi:MAG: TOBE domain-containing protein, partial [Oscillospiraceae bacterium]|nr:TOBE domain-containing protein [Oscillospiraceae bacterium]